MPTTQTPGDPTATAPCLYMALELAGKEWKLALTDGSCARPRRRKIAAASAQSAIPMEVQLAKAKLGLGEDAEVRTVYEAGWDGFWVHRMLAGLGYRNVVIDPTSLRVDRRKRQAKTDRLDAEKMVAELVRHHRGEKVWRVVRVPSVADEDARQRHREREVLKKQRVALGNRIRGLLQTQGTPKPGGVVDVKELRRWDGEALPPQLAAQIERLQERLQVATRQLQEIEKEMKTEAAAGTNRASEQARRLAELRSVSARTGLVLATEIFSWRQIENRRQLGALVGLVGTPYDSGGSQREQGISKAGNPRLRALLIELAWLWLRYQPESALSRWYQNRFSNGPKRTRRIGIVALARKLLIAFWRYLEHGVVPDGAVLRAQM